MILPAHSQNYKCDPSAAPFTPITCVNLKLQSTRVSGKPPGPAWRPWRVGETPEEARDCLKLLYVKLNDTASHKQPPVVLHAPFSLLLPLLHSFLSFSVSQGSCLHTASAQAPSFPQFLFHYWDSGFAEGSSKMPRADTVLEAFPFLGPCG